jgi:hypothetical protein
MKLKLLECFFLPVCAVLTVSIIIWLLGLNIRLSANELKLETFKDSISEVKDTIISVKADTSSILCWHGEKSRCKK